MEMVVPFMEHKAPEIDEGWAFDQALERVKAKRPPASKELKTRTAEFRMRMKEFLSKSGDKEAKSAFEGRSTWVDIQKEAAEAVEKYNGEGHSRRKPFEKVTLAFNNVACRLEFLIELLPDGDYTSILCGGLRLVFNAAKRMKHIRGLVLTAFDSLGENIENTKSYIRIYSQDRELQKRAEDLYVAILEAVEGITIWLRQNPMREGFKAFFQQSQYGQVFADKITTDVQTKSAAFDSRVRACLHSKVQEIGYGVDKIDDDVASLTREVRSGIAIFQESFEETVRQDWQRKHALENLLADLVKRCEWMQHMQIASMTRQAALEARVRDTAAPVVQVMVSYVPQPKPGLTILQLLELLESPISQAHLLTQIPTQTDLPILETIARDNEFVSNTVATARPAQQSRAGLLMQEPTFQQWFKSSASGALVVHGNERGSIADAAVSPVSYMCSLLDRTLRRLGHPPPLVYYCGLHAAPDDPLGGAGGLLRAVIAQLLAAFGGALNLGFLGDGAAEEIRRQDLWVLCRLFQGLLESIGGAVVFCLIDGVSVYETSYREEEMRAVMQFLNDLAVGSGPGSGSGLIFKLMVADGTLCRFAREWLPEAEELFLPEQSRIRGEAILDESSLLELHGNSFSDDGFPSSPG